MKEPFSLRPAYLLRYVIPVFLVLSIVPALSSCDMDAPMRNNAGVTESGIDKKHFAAALQKAMSPASPDSIWNKTKLHTVPDALHRVYAQAGYEPLWIHNTQVVQALIQDIENLQDEGLNAKRYQLDELKTAMKAMRDGNDDLSAIVHFDTTCTQIYLQASRDLLLGVLAPRKADSLWFHSNDSSWSAGELLLSQLHQRNTYPSLDSFKSTIPTYALLRTIAKHYRNLDTVVRFISLKRNFDPVYSDSIITTIINTEVPWLKPEYEDTGTEYEAKLRGYQLYYGLKPTGKLDSATQRYLARLPDSVLQTVYANMERLRWMNQHFEQEYIVVNIPLMELFLRRNNADVMQMNVVVGKVSRQTPSLNADMTNILINPSWGVPPTILKNDVLPGLFKIGGAYLRRKGLTVYDFKGRKVSPGAVNSKNYKRFVFRQPPGYRNALGSVKFNLPNRWDIYLHDTPHREDFVKRYRALSSGCVRIEEPREMAEYILAEMEGKEYDLLKIDSIIQTRITRHEELQRKLPVHIIYLTAFEDETDSYIRFMNDVYKKDRKLIRLLQQG